VILGNPCPVSLLQVAVCNHYNAGLSSDKGGEAHIYAGTPCWQCEHVMLTSQPPSDELNSANASAFVLSHVKRLSPSMYHDIPPTTFSDLREEFRVLQSGFRRENAMAEQALKNSWLTNALLGASERRTESDPSAALSSSHLSPFRSSESSHSAAESERAQSEVTPTTIASGSDDLAATLQPAHQFVAENGEGSLDGALVHQRSRKGHKKSREGCFNCKRRKIKVNISLKLMFKLTIGPVPRNSASM
jgi:hypothetical protein